MQELDTRLLMDRRFAQADRLIAAGGRSEGVLAGDQCRFEDGTENTIVRVSWFAPQERQCGILLGTGRREGLRLGASCAIRVDEDVAVLAWPAMWAAEAAARTAPHPVRPGPRHPRHRVRRPGARPLGDVDARRAPRVESFAPRTVLGHAGRRRGHRTALRRRRALGRTRTRTSPFYGAWFVHPGADVPVVLDPGGGDRVQIDWRRLAIERAAAGGRWQDRPPEGSLAAARLAAAPPATAGGRGFGLPPSIDRSAGGARRRRSRASASSSGPRSRRR